MSTDWAVSIPLEHVVDAAPLRSRPDVEACVADDRLWLRGGAWSEDLDRSLRRILGAERFERIADNQIARWDCSVPSDLLPDGPWVSFREWLQPVAPQTLFPAKNAKRVALRLVRTSVERTANLMVVDFGIWRKYALSAPQVRLHRWSFAASEDCLAVIRGEPLPPLPGTRYAETIGVAVPLGWTWQPKVSALVVRQVLGIADEDLALFTVEGVCQVLHADDFVRATRSAVRLTEKELGRES